MTSSPVDANDKRAIVDYRYVHVRTEENTQTSKPASVYSDDYLRTCSDKTAVW